MPLFIMNVNQTSLPVPEQALHVALELPTGSKLVGWTVENGAVVGMLHTWIEPSLRQSFKDLINTNTNPTEIMSMAVAAYQWMISTVPLHMSKQNMRTYAILITMLESAAPDSTHDMAYMKSENWNGVFCNIFATCDLIGKKAIVIPGTEKKDLDAPIMLDTVVSITEDKPGKMPTEQFLPSDNPPNWKKGVKIPTEYEYIKDEDGLTWRKLNRNEKITKGDAYVLASEPTRFTISTNWANSQNGNQSPHCTYYRRHH